MGNHETIPPDVARSVAGAVRRLAGDALPARATAERRSVWITSCTPTYHWRERNIDFISLDNATPEQFDPDQMKWLHAVLARDEASPQIRSIVVGMHEALPGSISNMHSMSESDLGDESGREAYEALWHAHDSAHKRVYVLASHSHFYMDHVFETADWKDKVLPGWIVGTAGAQRYKLPAGNHSRATRSRPMFTAI